MSTFALRRIAGAGFDGTCVTTTFGKIEIPIVKADYGDALERAMLSYVGSQEIDERSPGSYKVNPVKITVTAMVLRTLIMPNFSINGFGADEFPLVIARSHPTAGADSDMLRACSCTNLSAAYENSNKLEETTLEFSTTQVLWTRRRMTINRVQKAGGLTAVSKF